MASGIKEENLSLALRYIVDNFGKNTLLNAKKVESILSDLIPKSEAEINWMVDAINLGITKILLDQNIVDDRSKKDAIKRAQDVFKKQYVAELRMDYILDNVSYALGWSNIKVDNLNDYEAKKKSKQSKKIELKKEPKKQTKESSENIIKKPTVDNTKVNPVDNSKKQTNINNQNNNNPSNKSNKKLLPLLLIPLIIVIFLISKLFSGVGDVVVSDFYFNKQYDLQGSTYIFDEYENVELSITLDSDKPSEIDESKISYAVDNASIFYFSKKTDTVCTLMGVSEGSTVLRIYYDGEEIESISIGFGDIEGSEDETATVDQIHSSSNITRDGNNYIVPLNEDSQIQVVLNGDDADYSKLTYTIDDSNIASISGSGDTCRIYGASVGATNLRILYNGQEINSIYLKIEGDDDLGQDNLDANSAVDLVVKGYLANYSDARTYGDIYYVSDYLTSTGALYKELTKTIPSSYEKGIGVDVIGYTKNSMKEENGQYRVGMTIEYNVYKPEENNYQKEYMEFIVVQRSGEWLIDKYENWKLLEQYEI